MRYDIDKLKDAVTCPALLENDGWKVDLRESTPKAIKYRRSEGEIIIVVHHGRGWFDPMSEAKGDVFSLAERLGSPDFASAVKMVADLIGFEPTAPAWQRKARQGTSASAAQRWSVRARPTPGSPAWNYLTKNRALPEVIVSEASAAGVLREGPKGSVWAGHANLAGEIVGWEERGPDWRGFAAGGAKALFVLGRGEGLRVCITEAAIDAMSLAALEKRDDSLYASTGGGWAPATAKIIATLASRAGAQLVAACDGNDQGDIYSARLMEIASATGAAFMRLWPEAEDWNDQLRAARSDIVPTCPIDPS